MRAPVFIAWREQDRKYVLLVPTLAIVLGLLVGTLYIVFTTIRVDGDSMYPALQHEDRVLLTKRYDRPRRGDIVSVTVTDRGERVGVLKRVIALAGDEVTVAGDVAYVNGELSAAAPDAITGSGPAVFGPLVVPEGTVFVLGDNRPISLDSRFVGPVPLSDVNGRVVAVILPVHRFRVID